MFTGQLGQPPGDGGDEQATHGGKPDANTDLLGVARLSRLRRLIEVDREDGGHRINPRGNRGHGGGEQRRHDAAREYRRQLMGDEVRKDFVRLLFVRKRKRLRQQIAPAKIERQEGKAGGNQQ